MKRRLVVLLASAAAVLALAPGGAVADPNNESAAFDLVMFAPNRGVAPNGDRVILTCESRQDMCGTFSVHPKSVEATGEFTHTDSEGNVLGGGTWTATQLLSFNFYGCGVVLDDEPLPDDFCGGELKLRVDLTTPGGTFSGILTVNCIVGPQVPESKDEPQDEGVRLVIPGVINFNDTDGGGNIFIQTS